MDKVLGVPAGSASATNVGNAERAVSAVLGGTLVLLGLGRRSLGGAVMALAGGDLIYRGVRGHCQLYEALGVNTAQADAHREARTSADQPEVERSITIGRPADELYHLWLQPGTLPRIMEHFAEVTVGDGGEAHWVVGAPLGRSIEWTTHVVEDRPGKFLRWQSREGAAVPNEGSVGFEPAPGDRGTQVTLRVGFDPPGGAAGQTAAKLLGAVPRAIADKTLHYFKSLAETGEIPTTERQPAARADTR